VVPPHDTEGPGPEHGLQEPMAPLPQYEAPVLAPHGAPPQAFEGMDFDMMMKRQAAPLPAPTERAPAPLPPPQLYNPTSPEQQVEVDVERLQDFPARAPRGMVLTPFRLAILVVGVILALALAFGGGLLVGKSMSGLPKPTSSAEE
jgi:hypothetical protein